MSKNIILIGGPKHGETFELEDTEFKFPIDIVDSKTDMLARKESWTYVICKTADDVFYAVYNPLADPSIVRVNMLRNAINRMANGE